MVSKHYLHNYSITDVNSVSFKKRMASGLGGDLLSVLSCWGCWSFVVDLLWGGGFL